jgi:hypothetical protein
LPYVHIISEADDVLRVNYNSIPLLICKTFFDDWTIIFFYQEVIFGLGMPPNFSFFFFLFPESLLTPRLAPGKPFTGCIRHFVIDGRPVSFSKAALVSGAVSINSCPAA